MKSSSQNIPKALIYEMVNGKPIYYKGYKDYMLSTKQLDQIMGSSFLQSTIITNLVILLSTKLPKIFKVFTSELGLQIGKKTWRAVDIAIVEKSKLEGIVLENKYLSIPPKIVIEIDTKADLESISNDYSYFHKKTDELLDFGVEKVIWIFTDSKKIMIATKDKNWETQNWNKDVLILEKITINIEALISDNL